MTRKKNVSSLTNAVLIVQESTYLLPNPHTDVDQHVGRRNFVEEDSLVYVISAKKRWGGKLFDALCMTTLGVGWIVLTQSEIDSAKEIDDD